MDLPWGDKRTRQFITNVGLVTTNGPYGPNIMACEWTHHISYSPGLIAVCVRPDDATHANIGETGVFGVCLASTAQNVVSSVAGGSSGRYVDKVGAIKELGYAFYQARHVDVPMVKDAALRVECKLDRSIALGDHTMFVGEVLAAAVTPGQEPIAYHNGKYWSLGERISKPPEDELEAIRQTVSKYMKDESD